MYNTLNQSKYYRMRGELMTIDEMKQKKNRAGIFLFYDV